ncbi:MAG: HDOD domain-containing protein [Burkholderiales bacterium]|nr:HDOD domain-containing protein [Burkholderiales bacterium]
MQEHPILSQVTLGYSPMIDRQRAVIATRLTVFPERPDAVPDPQALFAAFAGIWPEAANPGPASARPLNPGAVAERRQVSGMKPVSLNIAGEALLGAVLAAKPPPQLMVEVPAFMALDPQCLAPLMAAHGEGTMLLVKGRPRTPLARELLPCFAHSIVDAGDDLRGEAAAPAGVIRGISTVQSGVHTLADVEAAFKRGAVATLGWPLDDPVLKKAGRAGVPADVTVVLELIDGVEREWPVAKLEAVIRRDPTLAFRLLRYLNSPAFGLSVEINSFGHAMMMLGHQRLKRWLALLLASSSKDPNAKPALFAAVRRGLLMEEFGRASGDAETRGELFICGVFSLLDKLLDQPLVDLFAAVPVPERVRQALLGETGPFQPYLELLRAVEREAVFDVRENAERMFMSLAEVNRAILAALANARALD